MKSTEVNVLSKRPKLRLSELKQTILLLVILGLVMQLFGFMLMNRTPEQRSGTGILRSWSVEHSGSSATANTVNTRQSHFEVDIDGRILRVDFIPYAPLQEGTPYFADEMKTLLAEHTGETVHYIYRPKSNTIVHMEIDGEVIVDKKRVDALQNRDSRIAFFIGTAILGAGMLLIPVHFVLKRRRRHARLSSRRSGRTASRPRR